MRVAWSYRFGMEVQRLCDVLERHLQAGYTHMHVRIQLCRWCFVTSDACVCTVANVTQGYGNFRGSSAMRPEGSRRFLVGDRYTVADMACFPWVRTLRGKGYDRPGQPRARDFLGLDRYEHLNRWCDRVEARVQVQRGIRVCSREPKPFLRTDHFLYQAPAHAKL